MKIGVERIAAPPNKWLQLTFNSSRPLHAQRARQVVLQLSLDVRRQGAQMITRTLGCLLMVSILVCAASAQTGGLAPVLLSLEDLAWTERSNGVWRAVVAGDDTAPGMYVYRFRFPSGFRVEPHFHPDDRTVIVLSGTFHVGFGDRFDESVMKALSQGSTWTEPRGQPHYAWAKDGEVVIQVVGLGPSGTTAISPTQ